MAKTRNSKPSRNLRLTVLMIGEGLAGVLCEGGLGVAEVEDAGGGGEDGQELSPAIAAGRRANVV